MRQSLQNIVVNVLSEMGIPTTSLIRTLAIQGGRLVAEKFRYDQGYAIWFVGSNVVEFYDWDGKLLKTVAFKSDENEAA